MDIEKSNKGKTVGYSTFHSHPSGTLVIRDNSTNGSTISMGGSTTIIYSFTQSPSPQDVDNAGNHINYVFGRGNNNVYIYNSHGIQAVIPMKNFVNPKTRKTK